MNEPTLDSLLQGYRGRQVPPLPGAFSQNVLREIRRRRDEPARGRSWIEEISALFLRPGLLAGSFAVVLAVGVVLPPAMSRAMENDQAAASLGLNVFSRASANMPSGLLAKAP